jgi:hypothetical protein
MDQITAVEYPLGGYEPSATPLDVSAEDSLVRAVRAALEAEGWLSQGAR